jgi:hypothetical protein
MRPREIQGCLPANYLEERDHHPVRSGTTVTPQPSTVRELNTLGPELFLKQYDTLRAEILLKMSQLAALAVQALVYPAALLAFALGNRSNPTVAVALLFVPVLSGLLSLQYFSVVFGLVRLARHVKKMEEAVQPTLPADLAWQSAIAARQPALAIWSQYIYFGVVFVAFVAASFALYWIG